MANEATQTITMSGEISMEITSANEIEALGMMPITPGILNPFGTVHAGAMVWFADVIATVLANGGAKMNAGAPDFPVAVTLNAQLLSNRQDGKLHARSTWVKRGRRVSTVRTEVSDDDGRVLMDLTSTHVSARG